MGFSPRAWRDGPAAAHRTTAEDSEATLRLLGRGVRIRALPSPAAFDEASGDEGAMARPRARWLGGHLKLLAAGAADLVRIALDSPRAALVLAADLWIRPRALVLAGLLLVAVASDATLVGLALRRQTGAVLPVLFASVLSKAALVFEFLAAGAARDVLGTPAELPPVSPRDLGAYLRMWLRAAFGTIRSPGAWHRARPEA
jgi:cellulose synthase/poly-beta-1,6-N-acetylglucosamine synthase-like glycosyltransferase